MRTRATTAGSAPALPLDRLDAVVLDTDGVLTDTARVHAAAWTRLFNAYLKERAARTGEPYRPFGPRDYLEYVDGKPRAEGAASFLAARGISVPYGEPGDPPERETACGLGNRKDRLFLEELRAGGARAFPASVALVRALRAAGVLTAAVSASRNAAAVLAAAGFAGMLDVQVDGVDAARLGLAGKPDPALFLEAARRLGVAPGRAAVVEDALAGAEAGRRGGFGLVVGVDRAGQAAALRSRGADVVVADLGELALDPPFGREGDPLDRTFEAVVLGRRAVGTGPGGRAVRARVAALRRAGARAAVVEEAECPGALERVLAELERHGVRGGLVLVVGSDFGPAADPGGDAAALLYPAGRAVVASAGPEARGLPPGVVRLGSREALVALLDGQLARRSARRCPAIDADPGWVIARGGDPALERVDEALLTVADGRFGTRGAREEDGPGTVPLTLAAGVYDEREGNPTLLEGPLWTGLAAVPPGRDRRVLDLRTGVLWRERAAGGGAVLRSARFACLARPGIAALRAEQRAGTLAPGPPLSPPARGSASQGEAGGAVWMLTRAVPCGGITAAACQQVEGGPPATLERLSAYLADPEHPPGPASALAQLESARAAGFDQLLAEHRAAWAARWADAEVRIDGDLQAELAVRFALFHLLASARGEGEAALGARGLTGPAYRGHVFWDADVFALPVLAAVHPPAARAMLEYRVRRLPAARQRAAERGLAGARFPWESAGDGREVTPPAARDPQGRLVAIRTGELEEHIVAAVAWAACRYAAWTGDWAFLHGAGRDLVLDGARYWAARARTDAAGRAHIDGVIGPDEYHEDVNDNAFTNVMARWHLRQAAALAEAAGGASAEEAAAWRRLATALVDGYDPATKLYQQFAGFYQLEPLVISAFTRPPVAADLLLGYERVRQAQVVKQADVLMLYLLVPEEAAPGSLAANLAFYGPRTAHGSSLSPAVHAALMARAGDPDGALELFRLTCRLDLDDLTGTTAGGLHLATFGGLWQALAQGFLGMDVRDGVLRLDPKLPAAWRAVTLRARVLGRRVRVTASHDGLEVTAGGPLRAQLPGLPVTRVAPPGARYVRAGTTWKEAAP